MQKHELVGHVDAVFAGKPVRFELARDVPSILSLEADLGSIRAALGRFAAGTWLMADVRLILARAHPVESGIFVGLTRRRIPDLHTGQMIDPPATPQTGIDPARLDRTLSSVAPITYALLASRVLEALLYGIEPERAVWHERFPSEDLGSSEAAA